MGKVFRPWRRHTTFLGVRGAYWVRIFAVMAIGLAAFFALGLPTVTVEQPLTTAERQARVSELESMRDAVSKRDALAALVGTDDPAMLDLTTEERELVEQAGSLGISASTTREQLDALVPTTETVEVERFGAIPRFTLLVAVPSALAFAWHLDMRGRSLCMEFRRITAFRRRQRFFLMGPRDAGGKDAV